MLEMLISIPGPQFLLIFALFSFVCILLARQWANADRSGDYRMPGPHSLDPILVSALSGGRNAVIRTVVFDLWDRNLIKIKGEGASAVIEGVPSREKTSTSIHEEIYRFVLVKERNPSELFSDAGLNAAIESHLEPTFKDLERQRLIQNNDDFRRTNFASWTALSVIVGIGGTKLSLGISHHKPIGFLIMELIVLLFVTLIALRPWDRKPTRLGHNYLKRLKKHFGWMREHLNKKNHNTGMDPVIAVAIFGVSPLIGSPLFNSFGRIFRTSSINHSSGCGGGCGGSSGCSGGGGGGGCGGCGGD